jgi:hypothetical protein
MGQKCYCKGDYPETSAFKNSFICSLKAEMERISNMSV